MGGIILDVGLRHPPLFPMYVPLDHTLYYSSHPPSLIVWPEKKSFRRTTNPCRHLSCLVVFSSVKIIWSVRCSQSGWFIIHNSADTIIFSSAFVILFFPPYCAVEGLDENRPHQCTSSLFIRLSLQIGTRCHLRVLDYKPTFHLFWFPWSSSMYASHITESVYTYIEVMLYENITFHHSILSQYSTVASVPFNDIWLGNARRFK